MNRSHMRYIMIFNFSLETNMYTYIKTTSLVHKTTVLCYVNGASAYYNGFNNVF